MQARELTWALKPITPRLPSYLLFFSVDYFQLNDISNVFNSIDYYDNTKLKCYYFIDTQVKQ